MAKSQQERDLDEVIAEVFPHDLVLAEYPIKLRNQTLYVDRLLPQRMVAIEVDGQQHFSFSPFFHGNEEGYRAARARDLNKAEWLTERGYALVRFRFDEKITATLFKERVLKALNDEL